MPQFDVFKNPRGGAYPFLLDIQADVLSALATRVVVPLIAVKKYGKPITRLHPTVTIGGVEYVLKFHDLAAIPATALGERVQSLANRRPELIAALDLLFTGA
jgi:toxin CcdB